MGSTNERSLMEAISKMGTTFSAARRYVHPRLTSSSAMLPGPPKRTPHICPVQILPQVHQRQKRAQNPRLQVIRQVQSAGRHPCQSLPALRNKPHDLALPFVRRIPQRRLPPHLRATSLNRERKVQHANLQLGQRRRRFVFASRHFAGCGHFSAFCG